MGWFSFSKKAPERTSARETTPESRLALEALERRELLVSNILPGTLLAGPSLDLLPIGIDVPAQPEGAVGTEYLVSVVNNRIFWRPKDGVDDPSDPSDDPVEVTLTNFFTNNPIQTDGSAIFNSSGVPLEVFATTTFGITFDTNQDANVLVFSPPVAIGTYNDPPTEPDQARILYDQYFGRFVVAAADVVFGSSSFAYIAVSASENPNDGWYFLSINTEFQADPTGRDADGALDNLVPHYVDGLQLGMTSEALILTGNSYGVADDIIFPDDGRIYGIPKQRIYEGGVSAAWTIAPNKLDYRDTSDDTGETIINLVPTQNFGPDADSNFLLSPVPSDPFTQQQFQGFQVVRINNASELVLGGFFSPTARRDAPVFVGGLSPGYTTKPVGQNTAIAPGVNGGPVLVNIDFFSTPVERSNSDTEFSVFPGLNQSGSVTPTKAVWRAEPGNPGSGSLWTSHTLNRPAPFQNSPTVRWYEFTARTTQVLPPGTFSLGGIFLVQQGGVDADKLDDGIPSTLVDTYSPAIVVDQFNNMGISFAASSRSLFIGAYYSGRFDADRVLGLFPGTTRPAKTLQAGSEVYYREFIGGGVMWGPWSAVGIDPSLDGLFWTFNAYASQRPEGNLFGNWSTTWGAFRLTPDSLIFAVDVSASMIQARNQDVNRDGNINSLDDINHDGIDGTPLDLVVALILKSFNDGILPGQSGTTGTVSLVIYGGTAAPVAVNFQAMGDDALFVDPTQASYNASLSDFIQTVLSLRVGSADGANQANVQTEPTLYGPAIDQIVGLLRLGGVAQAIMYSDGAGRLPLSFSGTAAPIRIDTVTVGPYQTIGYIGDFLRVSAATRGFAQTAQTNPGLNPLPPTKRGVYDGGFVPPGGLPPDPRPIPTSVQGLPGVPAGLLPPSVPYPPLTTDVAVNRAQEPSAANVNASPRRNLAVGTREQIDDVLADPGSIL